MKHNFEQAAQMACHQPKLVAKRALETGLCEVDLYLAAQMLYNEIACRDQFAAEIFARELRERGCLALACTGRARRPG